MDDEPHYDEPDTIIQAARRPNSTAISAQSFFPTSTPARHANPNKYGDKKRKLAATKQDDSYRRDVKGRGTAAAKRAKTGTAGFEGARSTGSAGKQKTTPTRARGRPIAAPTTLDAPHEEPVTPTKPRTKTRTTVPPTPPATGRRTRKAAEPSESAAQSREATSIQQLPTPTKTPSRRVAKRAAPPAEDPEEPMQADEPHPTPTRPRTRARYQPTVSRDVDASDEASSTFVTSGDGEAESTHPDDRDSDADEVLLVPSTPARSSSAEIAFVPPRATNSSTEWPAEVSLPRIHSLFPVLSQSRPLALHFHSDAVPATSSEARRKLVASTPCLPGLDLWERDLRSVIGRTAWEGEGNAMILVGGRGSGKSAIVSRALEFVRSPMLGGSADSFLLIRLNGLVHTNDRLTLREMARQLFVGGFGAGTSSASVAAKILADGDAAETGEAEDEEGEEEEDGWESMGSYAEMLSRLLGALEPGQAELSGAHGVVDSAADQATTPQQQDASGTQQRTKPLVIVLDHFDLFADRARQNFLYTLLDIVQGNRRRGGMAVIGLTAAVNVVQQLEKRVASRCQSRVHYLVPPGRDAAERSELVKTLLQLQPDGAADEFADAWNQEVDKFVQDKRTETWLENLWSVRTEAVPDVLRQLHPMLATFLSKQGQVSSVDISQALRASSLPAQAPLRARSLLAPLGAVDLSLVIAAKHLTSGGPAINFELCYDLYRKHIKRTTEETGFATQAFSKDTLSIAWDRLQKLEIVLPFSTNARANANSGRRFRMFKLVPWIAHVDQEVDKRVGLARHLKSWCKNASD